MKTKEELNAIREAQKRNAWIENVKRVKGYSQEEAEAAWTKDIQFESFRTGQE